VNAEQLQQVYGGEIADYLILSKKQDISLVSDNTQLDDLSNVYETQIKGKPNIDTTGIVSLSPTSMGLPPFERDSHFKKNEQLLSQTLSDIANQLGLTGDPAARSVATTSTLRTQSEADITAANVNVLQAMKELQDLGSI
jgi:hypothetical protein